MMRSYVCQQCRLQLRRPLLAPRYPQLPPGRTIVSFRNKQLNTTQEAPLRSSEGTSDRHNTVQGGEQKSVDSEAQRQQEASHEDLPPTDMPLRHHGANTRQTKTTPVAQKIHDNLEYKSSEGTKVAWNIFDKTYTSRDVPALTDPSFADVHHLAAGKIFLRLGNFICHEFQRGNTEVPTPTELLFRYEKLGITPSNAWKQAIANITYQLLVSMAKDTNTMNKAQEPTPTKKRTTEEIMTELLSMWKLFFQRFGSRNGRDDLESISPEWKNIPETEVAFRTGKNFGARLQEFHPAHATSPELQFSAISIFNCFSAESPSPSASLQQLQSENKIFLNLITSTLAGAEVHKALGHLDGDPRIKRNLSEDFRRSIAVQIDSAPDLARKINGTFSLSNSLGPIMINVWCLKTSVYPNHSTDLLMFCRSGSIKCDTRATGIAYGEFLPQPYQSAGTYASQFYGIGEVVGRSRKTLQSVREKITDPIRGIQCVSLGFHDLV